MAQLDSPLSSFAPIRTKTTCFFLAAILAVAPLSFAQQSSEPLIEGYVTAVSSPDEFNVNGNRVLITDETSYAVRGGTNPADQGALRQQVRVGAYVYVTGEFVQHSGVMKARTVVFRDDLDKKLAGLGVIQQVIARGTETVFEADGYHIRITPATQIRFSDPSLTLAKVDVNTWVKYQGQRNEAGELVASSVVFLPGKLSQQRSASRLQHSAIPFRPAGSTRKNPAELAQGGEKVWGGEVRLGAHWYRIPQDPSLQGRVDRVGMSLVPAYQKEMPANHPSKIPFRFYAVDDSRVRTEICSTDGLILISKQMVDRLKSNDELAAVLADGVAYNLQRQAARLDLGVVNVLELGGENASLLTTAGLAFPVVGLVTELGAFATQSKIDDALEDQRGRVALTLMADAGYDPRQAPEAWRLLEPKHLPANPQALKYPRLSGYQLGILNLQYNTERARAPEKTVTEAALSGGQ
jgi:Domain of unknown function (DUF5666)